MLLVNCAKYLLKIFEVDHFSMWADELGSKSLPVNRSEVNLVFSNHLQEISLIDPPLFAEYKLATVELQTDCLLLKGVLELVKEAAGRTGKPVKCPRKVVHNNWLVLEYISQTEIIYDSIPKIKMQNIIQK
jgi:hypothetical protein